MSNEGFISNQLPVTPELSAPANDGSGPAQSKPAAPVRYHFVTISEQAARLIFSPASLVCCFLLMGIALIALK